MKKLFTLTGIFLSFSLLAQKPKQLNSSEIFQKIKKLNVLGNVLYLAAHPDDENTRFISYTANEKLYNTAYLSLTRGDGGQNLIGTEIREELGLIRTQELLAARRTDGGMQYFTRANDFGYSKNPEETFDIWDKEKILGDVIWTIRKFRPDVIVCRFPTDGGGGHGHHTASALLALEAFDLANDPTSYPEQLEYLDTWQPTRVVINTGRWWNDTITSEDPNVVELNIGKYNPLLGISYNELAALSRSQHKCQGFGSTGTRGEQIEYFEHKKGKRADKSVYDGFDDTWNRVSNSEEIQALVEEIVKTYDINNPSYSFEKLVNLKVLLKNSSDKYWSSIKTKEVDYLLQQVLGLYFEAKADDFSKTINDTLKVDFEFTNRSNQNIEVLSLENTEFSFNTTLNTNIKAGERSKSNYTFTIPNMPSSQPYWLVNKPTLGTYQVDNQLLIGKPENDPSTIFYATVKSGEDTLTLALPLIYKWNDPVKGELYRPFIVTPKTTTNLNQGIYLYSDKQPQTIKISVKALTDNESGEIKLQVPNGWLVSAPQSYQLKNKNDEIALSFEVSPDKNPENGIVQVMNNNKVSYAYNNIVYDHIPTQVWFPNAESKLIYVNIEKPEKKIAYIKGAGDVVPEALENIGYTVDILDENALVNLDQYDAIITGIRFVNVNDRAGYILPKLFEYVENGGNLIMQYNTRHRLKTKAIAPYELTLSRDRVTEEDSDVKILAPKHPVLNYPNKITEADFNNWVQERGLYFPSKWGNEFTPILSWHDKNETPKDGSLLVAKYGNGNYVYTGISFFRELPAGVPGAYRLLVNLICLE